MSCRSLIVFPSRSICPYYPQASFVVGLISASILVQAGRAFSQRETNELQIAHISRSGCPYYPQALFVVTVGASILVHDGRTLVHVREANEL